MEALNKEGRLDRSRDQALILYDRILTEKIQLDDALNALFSGEVEMHRPWITDVVSGALRWRGRIELILDSLSEKKKTSGFLRTALTFSLYQILEHSRVVPERVVSETVDWVRDRLGEHPSKFANAVLRRVVSVMRSGSQFRELASINPAAWHGLPTWAWEKIEDARGTEFATKFALSSLERPTLWLREKNANGTGATPREETTGGRIEDLPGFREGKWIVQDLSNQKLIGKFKRILESQNAPKPAPKPARILDLCAAPGGKSIALSWEGFKVTAVEANPNRNKLLDDSLKRTNLQGQVERIEWKDLVTHATRAPWDAVWLDAPCSSFGILRRHPEIRWNRNPRELVGVHRAQAELLKTAMNCAKPGGIVFYSVCTPFKEECEQSLETWGPLAEWKDVELSSPSDEPFGDAMFSAWRLNL